MANIKEIRLVYTAVMMVNIEEVRLVYTVCDNGKYCGGQVGIHSQ